MSTNNLKAKFEKDIKGATPKGTETLRRNVPRRGSIPTIGPVRFAGFTSLSYQVSYTLPATVEGRPARGSEHSQNILETNVPKISAYGGSGPL